MVPEGTPGKWTLSATHPDRREPIAEIYATASATREREANLKQAGYTVKIELSEARTGS